MKLELLDAEVARYMAMDQQLTDLTRYVDDLKTALSAAQEYILQLEGRKPYQEKPAESKTPSTRAPETEEREDYKPGNPTANFPPIRNIGDWQMYCANPTPLLNKGSMWTEWENSVIHQAVGKDAAIFKIPYIAKMLGRTIVAIEMQAKKLKFEVIGNKIRYPL